MSKVLIDRELLAGLVSNNRETRLDAERHMYGVLANQPAEAEGVEVVCITQGGCNVTWTATKELSPAGTALMSVRQHQRILSAVTAERDRLRKDAERWRYVSLQGDDTHWLNLLRVDLEDFGGNINAAVDALIDGEAPAMAAKEAGTEHVCSGCGAKGWTGNCLECIPY